MMPKEALARILAVIVLLALAPTLVVLYSNIDSNIGLQSYRNWTADDPLPTITTVDNYYKLFITNISMGQGYNFNSTHYVYYIEYYYNGNMIAHALVHWNTYNFTSKTGSGTITETVYWANNTQMQITASSTASTQPSFQLRPLGSPVSAYDIAFYTGSQWHEYEFNTSYYPQEAYIYAVYPKVSGSSNTSIVGALLPVFLLAIAAAVLSKLGL